jgi:hypothetical protein
MVDLSCLTGNYPGAAFTGHKKTRHQKKRAGAVALAEFIRRPQAEVKSAQSMVRLDEAKPPVNTEVLAD